MVEKEDIEAYRDYALDLGHPVHHVTYPSIKNGEPLETSASLVSGEINRSRLEIGRENLNQVRGATREQLEKFFLIDDRLYGKRDPRVGQLLDALPALIARVDRLLGRPEAELEQTLSSQLKSLEARLAAQLTKADPEAASRMAGEVMESLVPRAILVGHSAGGVVAYTLAVNPAEAGTGRKTFDGGHGLGEVIMLGSPVAQGMPRPAPPGLLETPFYQVDKNVLRPFEELPTTRLARLNPFVDAMYSFNKGLTRTAWNGATTVSMTMTSPFLLAASPGFAQVMEGDEFLRTQIQERAVPERVSVVSVTNEHDRMAAPERCLLDEGQGNTHNLPLDLQVSQARIDRERPTWAHVQLAAEPEKYEEQMGGSLLANPGRLPQMLHPRNDDGFRFDVLSMLRDQLAARPEALSDTHRQALEAVASERQPFLDAPSYLATGILATI